jgi:hypothetical protein
MMFPVIIDQAGPLPIKTSVKWPSSNTVVVAVSGSAYAQKPGTMLTVKLTIHDTTETIQVYANQASTHMALPTGFFARDGEYGQVDVTLSAVDGNTVTDQNDHFQVALIY